MNRIRQFGYQLNMIISRVLIGRNGFDNMARTTLWASIIFAIINVYAQSVIIYFLWVIFLGYTVFRVFSKNITKRYAENQKFLEITKTPRSNLNLLRLQVRDRETSRYYICRKCHQQIRVPKGKGRIEIRCPKCGERFIRKT